MLGWEFPPFLAGGLGVHCLELTRELAAMGHTVDFYMPRMPSVNATSVADQHQHLRILEVDAEAGLSPYGGGSYEADFNAAVHLYNQRLVGAFTSFDADVLHCHDWITVEAALQIRERTGIPLVFTVHSTEHDRSAGFYPQHWIEAIERRGVHGADRVIGVSDYTRRVVQRTYAASPERIAAIPNGVDARHFATAARDYGRADRVLFLSRISRQKGPLLFLQAARRVLQSRPDARFVMAGKGEMLRDCIDYALHAGILRNVEFAGYVAGEDLASFYAAHDAYVLPSVSEPFGISVLEAMGSGLPTIVSRTSGVGECVEHALKVDHWDTDEQADLTLQVLASEGLRRELGRNAAREARSFTWRACAEKTVAAYAHAVREPRADLHRNVAAVRATVRSRARPADRAIEVTV